MSTNYRTKFIKSYNNISVINFSSINCKQRNENQDFFSSPKKINIPNVLEEMRQEQIQIKKLTEEELFYEKIKSLEETEQKTFSNKRLTRNGYLELSQFDCFFYHGIRLQNKLEKLEKIFQDRAILAGNYQKDSYYYNYHDNCNEGEYISLTTNDEDFNLCFETFVKPNLALIIVPNCDAIETFYLPFDEWEKRKDLDAKNRYSYVRGEYQVKKEISFDLVVAIGVPINLLKLSHQEHLIAFYLTHILKLLEKYNINLPIVDHSNYNRIIYLPSNYTIFNSKQKKLTYPMK